MIVYFAMLTFICALALWSLFLPAGMRFARPVITGVGYSTMILFVGLRDHVGADWTSYDVIFRLVNELPVSKGILIVEPLYYALNRIAFAAGGDIHLVNLACAIILIGCLLSFSRLADIDPNLLLFLSAPYLLFVVGMGYTRQSVAVGLGLTAIANLRRGNSRWFYFYAILAMLFHYSAVVLIALWWVRGTKRMVVAALVLLAASPALFLMLTSARYEQYTDNSADMQSHGVWTRIALIALALLVIYTQRFHWAEEKHLRSAIVRGAIALAFLAVLSLFLSTMADRICLYLFFIYVLGMGKLVDNARNYSKYLSLYFLVSLSYAVFLAWFGFSAFAAGAWFPYGNALFTSTAM